MDSSDHPQTTNSTESMSSDTADNSSMMALSKRDIFLSTYNRRQKFTFPDSIMHYIAKNPKNATVYQKMIKRCKYFFIKNPILVFSWLRYGQNGWETTVKDDWKSIDMNKLSSKLWITDGLMVYPEDVSNVASSIIPKIYRCDVKRLDLENQVISLNELIFLCSSVKELILHRVTVKNDDDTVVAFEKLSEQFPNADEFEFTFTTPSNNTSNKTFKELWKIPHLSNYDNFYLFNIPEIFDIESFYCYMKKNKKTYISLNFSDEISEEFQARLEAIVDEIIGAEQREYKPPCIHFSGLDREKYNELYDIFDP